MRSTGLDLGVSGLGDVLAGYDARLLQGLQELAGGGPTDVGAMGLKQLTAHRGHAVSMALGIQRSKDDLVRRIFGE